MEEEVETFSVKKKNTITPSSGRYKSLDLYIEMVNNTIITKYYYYHYYYIRIK